MIINMSTHATKDQINHVIERVRECGFEAEVITGAERTVIGVVGKNRGRRAEVGALRVAPGVDDIIPIAGEPGAAPGINRRQRPWHSNRRP